MKPIKKVKGRPFKGGQIAMRYSMLVMMFCLLAGVIFCRAAQLMLGEPRDYWMAVSDNHKPKLKVIEPTRGNILAAGGEVLATTLPEYQLFYEFMSYETDSARRTNDQLKKDRLLYTLLDSTALGMHDIFPDIDPEEFKEKMLKSRMEKTRNLQLYSKLVTYVDYCRVKELPLFRMARSEGGGFHGDAKEKRTHPYGNLARTTVGARDTTINKHYGLELSCDSVLAGQRGIGHYEKIGNQNILFVDSAVVHGCDVQTTLDVYLQDLVEKTLIEQLKKIDAEVGMCVLMDVETGDIKAITSQHRTSSGEYFEASNQVVWERREPGSVFKPMSFMVAFEDGKIDLNSSVHVGNGQHAFGKRWMKDANWRHGGYNRALSATEIIQHSSNVGVSVLIEQAYRDNPAKFVEGLDRIGIRTKFDIPLKEYAGCRIRFPDYGKDGKYLHWSNTTLPWMSIGYETSFCPLQTLAFYNAVANGGRMVQPRLVTAYLREGQVVEEFPVKYVHANRPDTMMCSKATLRKVQQCLEAVVGKKDCTGMAVYTKQFRIAGKTGTAQIWEKGGKTNKLSVSFAGYFPVEKPKYSMIVVIERGPGGGGGMDSGPVFKKVAETIWARENLADPPVAADTTSLAKELPVMSAGNVDALTGVLGTLGVPYQREATDNPDLDKWGRNVSHDPQKAVISGEPLIPAEGKAQMPDLKGYGVRDAVFRLERLGLKVHIAGQGRVVSQSIAPGSTYRRGQRIDLQLSTREPSRRPTAPQPQPATPEAPTPAQPAAPAATPTAAQRPA